MLGPAAQSMRVSDGSFNNQKWPELLSVPANRNGDYRDFRALRQVPFDVAEQLEAVLGLDQVGEGEVIGKAQVCARAGKRTERAQRLAALVPRKGDAAESAVEIEAARIAAARPATLRVLWIRSQGIVAVGDAQFAAVLIAPDTNTRTGPISLPQERAALQSPSEPSM